MASVRASNGNSPVICFNCGQAGHIARDCPVGRGQGTFSNNAGYWQSRQQKDKDFRRIKELTDLQIKKAQEKKERKKVEEDKRKLDAEQRKARLEQEQREEQLRRMIADTERRCFQETERVEQLAEEAGLRTIASVARDLRAFKDEFRTEVKMTFAMNAKTPKRDISWMNASLESYLTEEGTPTDEGKKIPLRRTRGKRSAPRFGEVGEFEEEMREQTRDEYEANQRGKVSTPQPVSCTARGAVGSNNKGGIMQEILGTRDRLLKKDFREIKKICEERDVTYVLKEQAVRELVNLATDGKIALAHAKQKFEIGGYLWVSPIVLSLLTQNARQKGKGYLRQLLEMPYKRKELSSMLIERLMHLYNSVGTFSGKNTRKAVKDFIANAVAKKAGVNVKRKITVKVQFRKKVCKREVKNVLLSKIGSCELHPAIAGLLSRKLQFVRRRNRSVSEIQCNHRILSRSTTLSCTCSEYALPRTDGHILARIGEVEAVPQLALNGKNIVRPRLETSLEELSTGMRQGLTVVLGSRVRKHLEDLHLDKCFTIGCNEEGRGDESLVLPVKRKLQGLAITPIDRNVGDMVVMCPLLYGRRFDMMFMWNVAYLTVSNNEAEILQTMKAYYKNHGLDQLAAWNCKGAIGKTFVLPCSEPSRRGAPLGMMTEMEDEGGARLHSAAPTQDSGARTPNCADVE
ncbi:hypothetical protein CBR_g25892 [Chara braunii]|uniref:CCHC-type domain-containing protein n=1 Tax=Chara braunii TaxID=69332 RepID=A0A388L6L8_CHABU|nr:hypothetical protein CBR_g25892 [Chara braunii]|eukprot:GBG77961.1 hypothetical protein CBR_g25892 [Chara braunii]